MSHLKVYIVKSPCAVKRPGETVGVFDIESFTSTPQCKEIISIQDVDYIVESVKHVVHHGAIITVSEW